MFTLSAHLSLLVAADRDGQGFVSTPIDYIADVLVLLGCVLIVLFTLTYGLLFRWWQTRAGRGIFFTLGALSVALVKATFAAYDPADYPFRDVLRLVTYLLLPLAVGYMFYALIRNWMKGPTRAIEIQANVHPRTGPTAVIRSDGGGQAEALTSWETPFSPATEDLKESVFSDSGRILP